MMMVVATKTTTTTTTVPWMVMNQTVIIKSYLDTFPNHTVWYTMSHSIAVITRVYPDKSINEVTWGQGHCVLYDVLIRSLAARSQVGHRNYLRSG